jgi:Lrp/AsnC family transcriptional regulator, regulator for asnA, asnC and gidA
MDKTDRLIVELLRTNGRRSNVEIARELGISEGTVRKRVDRLLAGGTVRISALADPAAVGCGVRTMIFFTVELPQLETIGDLLREMPEVLAAYQTTGEYDLVMEAVFESDRHLISFLTERVAGIPGVLSSKVAHIPKVLKCQYEWELPDLPVPMILIVDDDPDFVEVTRLVLESQGYRTATASNGNDALRAMMRVPPDLVIMDVMMDGILDGWDASGRIRSHLQLRDTPILVVSSITTTDYLSMLPTDDDHLIDNFLSKPIEPQVLVAEVGRLLKQRERS